MPPPEDRARIEIDRALQAAGWLVQDPDRAAVRAGPGVAVRRFPLARGDGEADYLLYVDGQAVGEFQRYLSRTTAGDSASSTRSSTSAPTPWTGKPGSSSPPSSACTPSFGGTTTWERSWRRDPSSRVEPTAKGSEA